MAIIAPSLQFEGQAVSQGEAGRIVKPDVKIVNFRSKENKNGVYLYILPPYKADSKGNGVWYKVLDVRAEFGVNTKERFVELPDSPVAYFENQAKYKYPEYTQIQKAVKDGRDVKIHPTYGKLTKRFLYNVAYASALQEGAHVIEVPSFGVADIIDRYHRTKLLNGSSPTMVCEAEHATPVLFHLNLELKGGQPWVVQPEPTQKCKLPDELSDNEYLYNLDDVYIIPSNEELYEKLRAITPAQIFNDCMAGYGASASAPVASSAVVHHTTVTPTIAKPTLVIAKPGAISKPSPALGNITPVDANVERVQAPATSNPILPSNASVSAWLKPKVAAAAS